MYGVAPICRVLKYDGIKIASCRVAASVGGVRPTFDQQPDLAEHGCELV